MTDEGARSTVEAGGLGHGVLQPSSGLPPTLKAWIAASPSASRSFSEFFSAGGVIAPQEDVRAPSYRFAAEGGPPRIVVDQAQWDALQGRSTPPDHAWSHMFGGLLHEVGHHRYNTQVLPFTGASAEDYVGYRSDIEARAITNAFPAIRELESEPGFDTRVTFLGLGYLRGSELSELYGDWKRGALPEGEVVQRIASQIEQAPYGRAEPLVDHDGDGRLTHRDAFLRDYGEYVAPQATPAAPPAKPADPTDATHPEHRAYQRLGECVRNLDQQTGKEWDQNSERFCASLLVLAKQKGFTADDDLRVAFNQPTDRLKAGELVHLYRVGPNVSPDPFANRAHMSTADTLSMPVEARYQQAEAMGLARTEAMQLAAQNEQVRANDIAQGGPRMKV